MTFEMSYSELTKKLTEAHWTLCAAIEKSDKWTIMKAREEFEALRKEVAARKIEKEPVQLFKVTEQKIEKERGMRLIFRSIMNDFQDLNWLYKGPLRIVWKKRTWTWIKILVKSFSLGAIIGLPIALVLALSRYL